MQVNTFFTNYWCRTNSQRDQKHVGLIHVALLVEHCTCIAEGVMGKNPVVAWIFFQASISQLLCVQLRWSIKSSYLSAQFKYDLSCVHKCDDHWYLRKSRVVFLSFLGFWWPSSAESLNFKQTSSQRALDLPPPCAHPWLSSTKTTLVSLWQTNSTLPITTRTLHWLNDSGP